MRIDFDAAFNGEVSVEGLPMKREKLKNWLITIGLLVALGGVAGAGGKAIDWFQVNTTRASNPCQAGKACKYVNSSDGKWHSVSTAGTDTADGSGGSGTLATSVLDGHGVRRSDAWRSRGPMVVRRSCASMA
jgi:hypothetical protein